MSASPSFASVVIDVDSTLCGIEGIDWLARRRGADVAEQIAALTDQAMSGSIALDTVYGARLMAVRPGSADVNALAEAYRKSVAPGAAEAIAAMRQAGVQLRLISGGLREAILPVARDLGFRLDDVHAVDVHFGARGEYEGFVVSPLTTQSGKAEVVRSLRLAAPVLAVGDGATDAAMRPAVDAFAAFTGFIRRAAAVEQATFEVASFAELARRVLTHQ